VPGTTRTARPPQPGPRRPAGQTRTRFVFLVVALLGGGLLCLLLVNTVLAAGAFKITGLQQGNVALAQRAQALQAQIAAEEAPAALAERARALGMVVPPLVHFLDLKTGRIVSQPRRVPGVPAVPGYTP
jgi:cell division protein FtsB